MSFTAADAVVTIGDPDAKGWNDTVKTVAYALGVDVDSVGSLLYKYEVDEGKGAGALEATYGTVVDKDEKGFTVSSMKGTFPIADGSYLVAKDGKHAHYIFSLAGWDGLELIEVSGLWPKKGTLSHASIYGVPALPTPTPSGGPTPVPDTGSTTLLLGVGVMGLGWMARRRS